MTDINDSLPDTIVESIARDLGVDAQRVAEVLRKRQQAGEIVIPQAEDVLRRAQAGVHKLGRYLEDQLAQGELPLALRQTLAGLCQRAGVCEIAPERVPSRPKEQGLVGAIFAMADAAERMPQELHLARVDVALFRKRGERIAFLRALLTELVLTTDLVLDNLSVDERQAADDLGISYGKVRAAVRSERRLFEPLAEVEDYLFGSQKLGAERRAMNLQRAEKLSEKLMRRARLSAGTEARKDIADNLSAVLEELIERRRDDRGGEGGRTPPEGK